MIGIAPRYASGYSRVDELADAALVHRVQVAEEERDHEAARALVDEPAQAVEQPILVEGSDDRAEAVEPLGGADRHLARGSAARAS